MIQQNFGYSASEYRLFRKYAWRYLLIFSFMYCAHYCTRLNLSNASALMMDELNWSTSDIGILTSTLFWTYGIGHLINGRLGEIVGPVRFVCFGLVLSVLANIFMSVQNSLLVMAIIWGLNGYFQSMVWSPGIATLTAWWPGNTRGFATGFANAFSGFGQVAATLMVALAFMVAPEQGWRAAFRIPVILPVALLVIYILFTKASPENIGLKQYIEVDADKAKSEEEMRILVMEKGPLFPYKYLLSQPKFLVWVVVVFASGLARYGLVTWIPLYFIERFGVDIEAGLLQSLALPVGMGIGTLIVPWLTDRYCPSDRLRAAVVSAILGAISIGIFYMLDPTIGFQLIIIEVMLFIAGFCIYAINGIVWAYSSDIGGRVLSGTSAGILDSAAYMGAAIQSLLFGFMLESGGWSNIFLVTAAFCILIAVMGAISSYNNKKKIC